MLPTESERARETMRLQVAIRADQPVPDIPEPTQGRGWVLNNGILEALWTEEEEELVLPQDVIGRLLEDLLDSTNKDGPCIFQDGLDDSLDSDDSEADYYMRY